MIAATKIYTQLTHITYHTSMSFYDHTPSGRILNRFGRDSNTIDDNLPFILNILLSQSFLLVGSCILIVYAFPPMLIILLLILVLYNILQSYYRASSRELKRLDTTYHSPVFNIMNECCPSVCGVLYVLVVYIS